jgi:hypothetical protein
MSPLDIFQKHWAKCGMVLVVLRVGVSHADGDENQDDDPIKRHKCLITSNRTSLSSGIFAAVKEASNFKASVFFRRLGGFVFGNARVAQAFDLIEGRIALGHLHEALLIKGAHAAGGSNFAQFALRRID